MNQPDNHLQRKIDELQSQLVEVEKKQIRFEAARDGRSRLIINILRYGPQLFALFVGICYMVYELKKMDPRS